METLKERLMVKIEDAERQKQDWHRAEIVAAVRKRGKTITALSIESGLSANTLKSALQFNIQKANGLFQTFSAFHLKRFGLAVIPNRFSLLKRVNKSLYQEQ